LDDGRRADRRRVQVEPGALTLPSQLREKVGDDPPWVAAGEKGASG
jgi:hypothetical protein